MKAASIADAAAVNTNVIKTLLANGLSTFPIKGNPVFSNGPKSITENPPDCSILCQCVFDNFILAEELFEKALWSLESCVLVSNKLSEEIFSSSESLTTFNESQAIFKLLQLPFF